MSTTLSKDYRGEWPSLVREYERLESDFLLLTDFIPLAPDPNAPNYQFGSPRTASFGLDSCTWVETAFKWLLFSPKFDAEAEVVQRRSEREDIALYRRLFEPRCKLSSGGRTTIDPGITIFPFEDFKNGQTPAWFADYSRPKHDRFALSGIWTMMHCLQSLAALSIVMSALVTPSMAQHFTSRVFRDTRFPSHLPMGSPFW